MVAHDRARHKLREKQYKHREFQKPRFIRGLHAVPCYIRVTSDRRQAAPDVDRVRANLKRIKTNREGQHQREAGPGRACTVARAIRPCRREPSRRKKSEVEQ